MQPNELIWPLSSHTGWKEWYKELQKEKNQNTIFLCPHECLLGKFQYTVNTVPDLSNHKTFVAIQ
jgi:hypothetical protein